MTKRDPSPLNPPPCRWPGCSRPSEYFAKDNRAKYGHLCLAHWYGHLAVADQELYVGAPQGAFGRQP